MWTGTQAHATHPGLSPTDVASYCAWYPVSWPCPWPILDIIPKSRPCSHSHLPAWPNSPEDGRRPSLRRHLQEQPEKTNGKRLPGRHRTTAPVRPAEAPQTCRAWSRLPGPRGHQAKPASRPGAADTAVTTSCHDKDPRRVGCQGPTRWLVVTLSEGPGRGHVPASGILFTTTF